MKHNTINLQCQPAALSLWALLLLLYARRNLALAAVGCHPQGLVHWHVFEQK